MNTNIFIPRIACSLILFLINFAEVSNNAEGSNTDWRTSIPGISFREKTTYEQQKHEQQKHYHLQRGAFGEESTSLWFWEQQVRGVFGQESALLWFWEQQMRGALGEESASFWFCEEQLQLLHHLLALEQCFDVIVTRCTTTSTLRLLLPALWWQGKPRDRGRHCVDLLPNEGIGPKPESKINGKFGKIDR